MVFNVAPTLLEIALVAAILSAKCGPALGAVTLGTVAGEPTCARPRPPHGWPAGMI